MVEIVRVSIFKIIGLFLFYLLSHYWIGVESKKITEEAQKDVSKQKQAKYWVLLFKWYPAIYVIITIIVLYA